MIVKPWLACCAELEQYYEKQTLRPFPIRDTTPKVNIKAGIEMDIDVMVAIPDAASHTRAF